MNNQQLVPTNPQPPATSAAGNVEPIPQIMPAHVAPVVPFTDHELYNSLRPEQQQRVSLLLHIIAEIENSPDGVVAATERLGVLHGISTPQLHRLRGKFKKKGWRALAAIKAKPNQQLPAKFIQFVRTRVEANQREHTVGTVFQQIRDAWRAGAEIEGYGTWHTYFRITHPDLDLPDRCPPKFYPAGWSDSNLYEQISTRAERALAKRGVAAMQRYIPHVVRDTSALRPLELITIDDFELDFLVRAINPITKQWEICRVAGLLAQDVATRRVLALGLVPRFKLTRKQRQQASASIAAHADYVEGESETTEEKKTRIGITRQDVQSLLHSVFSTHGRPKDYGVTILCENAAAAITADFEASLELLLGVQVARTGLISDKNNGNGFVQGGGKPWQKGWIEKLFAILWNEAGAFPFQKGSSYQDKPAQLEAQIAYAEKLFALPLAPEVIEKLNVLAFSLEDAQTGLWRIIQRIEQRDDHRMIGFAQRFVYQLPGHPGELTEAQFNALTLPREQLLLAKPLPRKESPIERWDRLMAACEFVKIADHVLALLLLTPKKVKLSNHRITFVHAGEGYTFADADSPVMKLPEDTELLGYFDASRPATLYVCDDKRRYIGEVKRRGPVDIRDHAALTAEAGEIERLVWTCVRQPVAERQMAEHQRLALADAQNVALQQQAGIEKPVRMPLGNRDDPLPLAQAIAAAPAAQPPVVADRLATAVARIAGERSKQAKQAKALRGLGNAAAELLDADTAPEPFDDSTPTDPSEELL